MLRGRMDDFMDQTRNRQTTDIENDGFPVRPNPAPIIFRDMFSTLIRNGGKVNTSNVQARPGLCGSFDFRIKP